MDGSRCRVLGLVTAGRIHGDVGGGIGHAIKGTEMMVPVANLKHVDEAACWRVQRLEHSVLWRAVLLHLVQDE